MPVLHIHDINGKLTGNLQSSIVLKDRWGNWGWEKLNNLLQAPYLVRG